MPDTAYAEPVPAVSQLAVMPFLAAVEGFLSESADVTRLRLTVHRIMERSGHGYLQQVSAYLGPRNDPGWRSKIGRVFPVTQGIIGAAFRNSSVWRTKHYDSLGALHADLQADALANGEQIDLARAAVSFLAVPFLSPLNQAVLILYAECADFNYFADNTRVEQVHSMCVGFCRLVDWLQEEPLPNIKNFPLVKGVPVTGQETVYQRLQEQWLQRPAPRFDKVTSFNFEA
jgi:hypothetical protein